MKQEGKLKLYSNGGTYKKNDRRVTVVKCDDHVAVEYRLLTKYDQPLCYHKHVHGKLSINGFQISLESAEATMLLIAQALGVDIAYKKKSHEKNNRKGSC